VEDPLGRGDVSNGNRLPCHVQFLEYLLPGLRGKGLRCGNMLYSGNGWRRDGWRRRGVLYGGLWCSGNGEWVPNDILRRGSLRKKNVTGKRNGQGKTNSQPQSGGNEAPMDS
jgi:hypothetical protein